MNTNYLAVGIGLFFAFSFWLILRANIKDGHATSTMPDWFWLIKR